MSSRDGGQTPQRWARLTPSARGGGLLATAEIKAESYARLMALLLQRGFTVHGVLPAQQDSRHD
jgi:hypothetical protein